MIDLTPLDVRKKKGDFRRVVRGYDPELVDDFLDMVAERLEELVKQNVALTERAEHLQEQVASYRERERALNEALVTAQQLRSEAQAQADREAELVRREAQSQAERIIEEGQRSFREIAREIEALQTRRHQFARAFRTLLERYIAELEVEESRPGESARPRTTGPAAPSSSEGEQWLSSLARDPDQGDEPG
ncbi:MAG: DivIVA domain-containing protein [Gemmatimonadota bacterium]|nr:MAG: DivIVA domain-containing protein [Gemmatimonadota bacterium]